MPSDNNSKTSHLQVKLLEVLLAGFDQRFISGEFAEVGRSDYTVWHGGRAGFTAIPSIEQFQIDNSRSRKRGGHENIHLIESWIGFPKIWAQHRATRFVVGEMRFRIGDGSFRR
jgi:hypothetical protein